MTFEEGDFVRYRRDGKVTHIVSLAMAERVTLYCQPNAMINQRFERIAPAVLPPCKLCKMVLTKGESQQ